MTEEPTPSDTLGDILPPIPTHSPEEQSPLASFKPWHLPRKQHVRRQQWGISFENLIQDLRDKDVLSYLCLPGEDLLDVQVLTDICKANGRRLRYVGFDSSETRKGQRTLQRIASEQIIRQTEIVDVTSEVIPDEFASIARTGSIGYKKLRDRGSYDVVNLDLCDAFTSTSGINNHDAMLALLTHQTHLRGEPWLLYLTTRAEVSRLQDRELVAYDSKIGQNIVASGEFAASLARILNLGPLGEAELVEAIRTRRSADTGFSGKWLAIAVGKWLLGILSKTSPWRVDLLSIMCYRTGLMSTDCEAFATQPPNLYSLVFRFDKIVCPLNDPTNLATSSAKAGVFDEIALAQKMASCVERYTIDLDCFFQREHQAHNALTDECASLLETRDYSREAYLDWLKQLPKISCKEDAAVANRSN